MKLILTLLAVLVMMEIMGMAALMFAIFALILWAGKSVGKCVGSTPEITRCKPCARSSPYSPS